MALDVDTKKRILNIIDTEVEFTFIKEAPWHTESVAKSLSALIRTTLFPITPTDNTKASEIATAVKNRVDKAGALLTPEEQEFLLQEINIRLVNSVVLPIEAAQKFYEEARTYDLHYSNIRTTLVTFFLTAAVGMLTVVAQDKFPNSAVPLYMGIPLAFALLSFLLGAYFLKLTRCCAVIESHLEKAIQNSAVERWLRLAGQFLPVHKWRLAND